jgi:hypothetical protein
MTPRDRDPQTDPLDRELGGTEIPGGGDPGDDAGTGMASEGSSRPVHGGGGGVGPAPGGGAGMGGGGTTAGSTLSRAAGPDETQGGEAPPPGEDAEAGDPPAAP